MSKASEDEFDRIQTTAKTKQTIEFYFMACLPSGDAMHVTFSMTPEMLEEVGPIRSFRDPKEAMEYWNRRGENMARLHTRLINLATTQLLEAILIRLAR